jgi:hypothetical protein
MRPAGRLLNRLLPKAMITPAPQVTMAADRPASLRKKALIISMSPVLPSASTRTKSPATSVCALPRRAEEVALPFCASFRAQKRQLFVCFDAFGDGYDPQAFSKSCNGADDRYRIATRSKLAHEGMIDLNFVEGKAAKVA